MFSERVRGKLLSGVSAKTDNSILFNDYTVQSPLKAIMAYK